MGKLGPDPYTEAPASGWLDQLLEAEEAMRARLQSAEAEALALRRDAEADTVAAGTAFATTLREAEAAVAADYAAQLAATTAGLRQAAADRAAAIRALPAESVATMAAAVVDRLLAPPEAPP